MKLNYIFFISILCVFHIFLASSDASSDSYYTEELSSIDTQIHEKRDECKTNGVLNINQFKNWLLEKKKTTIDLLSRHAKNDKRNSLICSLLFTNFFINLPISCILITDAVVNKNFSSGSIATMTVLSSSLSVLTGIIFCNQISATSTKANALEKIEHAIENISVSKSKEGYSSSSDIFSSDLSVV